MAFDPSLILYLVEYLFLVLVFLLPSLLFFSPSLLLVSGMFFISPILVCLAYGLFGVGHRIWRFLKRQTIQKRKKKSKKEGNQNTTSNVPHCNGIIIGGGFGGIGLSIELLSRGIDDFLILEKNGNFGGTWFENRYPNSACDVPSHVYSFSYEPNSDWSQKFSCQAEILDYLQGVAAKHNLAKYALFNTKVLSAHFNRSTSQWTVTIEDRTTNTTSTLSCSYLVSAVGQLNNPFIPPFQNLSSFPKERVLHSTQLGTDFSCSEFEGKRVAAVGFGPTAVQILPYLAEKASQLYVFINSTSYCLPRNQYSYPGWARTLFRFFPPARLIYRWCIGLYSGEFLWFTMITSKNAHGTITQMTQHKLRKDTKGNQEVIEKLSCHDEPFCKRILLSDELYSSMSQKNVRLLRAPTEKIGSFTEKGIIVAKRGEDGEVVQEEEELEVSHVVMMTGFRSTQFLSSFDVTIGDDDHPTHSLRDQWGERGENTEAYLGILIRNFPNLFLLYGPHTNRSVFSIVYMLECEQSFVGTCVEALVRSRSATPSLMVKPEAATKFIKEYDEKMKKLVFSGSCTNWYRVGGSGRVINNCHMECLEYWWRTLWVNWDDLILQ